MLRHIESMAFAAVLACGTAAAANVRFQKHPVRAVPRGDLVVVDVAQAVFEELKESLGLKEIEFVTVTSSDRIAKVVGGQVDMVVATMTITRSRDEDVRGCPRTSVRVCDKWPPNWPPWLLHTRMGISGAA